LSRVEVDFVKKNFGRVWNEVRVLASQRLNTKSKFCFGYVKERGYFMNCRLKPQSFIAFGEFLRR